MWIGAQAWVDTDKHGGKNPLVEAARELDILAGTRHDPRQAELDAMRGPKVADRLEDDPRFAQVAADPARGVEAGNAAGSMEAFMTMFGAPPPGGPAPS